MFQNLGSSKKYYVSAQIVAARELNTFELSNGVAGKQQGDYEENLHLFTILDTGV